MGHVSSASNETRIALFQAIISTANRRRPSNPRPNRASSIRVPTRISTGPSPLPSGPTSVSPSMRSDRRVLSSAGSPTHPLRAMLDVRASTSRNWAVDGACPFDSTDKAHDTARHVHVARSKSNRRRGDTREERDGQALQARCSAIGLRSQEVGAQTTTQRERFCTSKEETRSTAIEVPRRTPASRLSERIGTYRGCRLRSEHRNHRSQSH